MKSVYSVALLLISISLLSSCMVNRYTVGDGPVGREAETKGIVYSKKKQYYIFWGALAINQTSPAHPVQCGYQIKSSGTFVGTLLAIFTARFATARIEKIIVFEDSPCVLSTNKKKRGPFKYL